MRSSHHLLISLTVISLLTLAIDPVWGFYEGFIAYLISGNINNYPITRVYIYGAEPLAFVVSQLHAVVRPFPWAGLSIFLNIVVSVSLISRLVDRLTAGSAAFSRLPRWWVFVAASPAFLFVLKEYSFSSVGFLSASTALLTLWQLACSRDGRPFPWGRVLLLSLFFLNAFAYRIDSAMGATYLVLWFIVLTGGLLRTFRYLIIPGILSLTMVGLIYHSWTELGFLSKIEPYVYYVTDARYQPTVEMADEVDSIMVFTARQSFVNDTAKLNESFFEGLALRKTSHINNFNEPLLMTLRVAVGIILPTLLSNLELTLTYALSLLMIIVALSPATASRLLPMLLYNAALWITIFGLAFSLKMEKWHYLPMIQVSILINLVLLLINVRKTDRIVHPRVQVSLLATGILLSFLSIAADSIANRATAKERHQTLSRVLDHVGPERYLYIDCNSREMLNGHVFRPYLPLSRVLLYDQGQLAMKPEGRDMLDGLCNCNSADFNAFMRFLMARGQDIVILSSDVRTGMLSDYARIVHGLNIQFSVCQDFEPMMAVGEVVRCYSASPGQEETRPSSIRERADESDSADE